MSTKILLKDFTKAPISSLTLEQQILRLMYDINAANEKRFNKDWVTVSTQKDISKLLKDKYGLNISQPTISRAWKKLQNNIYVYGSIGYSIEHKNSEYLLTKNSNFTDSFIKKLGELSPFAKNALLSLSAGVYAYKIFPEKTEQFIDLLRNNFAPDTFFDILPHESCVYIILDKKSHSYSSTVDTLVTLPSLVKKFKSSGN